MYKSDIISRYVCGNDRMIKQVQNSTLKHQVDAGTLIGEKSW